MRTRSFPVQFLCLLAAFAAAGCASQPLIKEEPKVLFPPAPSDPRFRFEGSIRGAVDFRTVSLFDRLLGVDVKLDIVKPFDVYARGEKVYISDTARGYVHVVDRRERKVTLLGSFGEGKLKLPLGVRGSADGAIYVADGQLKTIMVYDAAGDLLRRIGRPGELLNPAGIAVNDELDRIYIADVEAHDIKVYSRKGDFLFQFGGAGPGDGQFMHPSFVVIDRRNGNVHVSDTHNFRVQIFDRDGKFIRKFGELGDLPGFFQRPKGVGIDSEGNSYVVEAVFGNFQVFNERGQVLTWVGLRGRQGGGVFSGPSGIYVDEQDRIFVADSLNRRVQVFQYLGEKWRSANPGEYEKLLTR